MARMVEVGNEVSGVRLEGANQGEGRARGWGSNVEVIPNAMGSYRGFKQKSGIICFPC